MAVHHPHAAPPAYPDAESGEPIEAAEVYTEPPPEPDADGFAMHEDHEDHDGHGDSDVMIDWPK